MSGMSFTWKGVSSDAMGVVVTKLPPIVIPARRDEAVVAPGRSGALHLWDGAWDEVMLPVECYLPYEQGGQVAGWAQLAAWLTGLDWLILSDRPGLRFRARLLDQIAMTSLVAGFSDRLFSLSFWADPFGYEAVPTVISATSAFTLVNPGSVFSEPVIELTATGDVTLVIGEKTLAIEDVSESVMIDVPAGLVYHGDQNLLASAETADWPMTIPVGASDVSWTGEVTQIVLRPNWRWL
jgi:phage-related protein